MAKKEQYIGAKKVVTVSKLGDKTPLGRDIVKVTFEDKSYISLPEIAMQRIVTDKPLQDDPNGVGSTLAQIREKKITPVIKEIIILMTEGGLTFDEIDPTLNRVVQSINWNTEEAGNRLWGVAHPGERSLLSADSIIKGNGPKEY